MGFDFCKRWSLVALLASSLVAADALAQRGERGGGGGRGRGGGGGGSSERSFSGGGGGGGDRGGGNRGGGNRGGGERSVRSGGGSRSLESSRSGRGSSEMSRSIRSGQSGRGSIETGRSARRSSDVGGVQRDFSRAGQPRAGRQQFDGSQSQTFRSADRDGMRSARSQWDGSRREYQANRPTDEQVREFLRLRRDGNQGQARDFTDRNFRQDGSRDLNRGGRAGQNLGQRDFNQQLRDGNRDRQFSRDGDANRRGDRDFRDRDSGDRDFANRQYDRWRSGAWSGDRDGRGDNRDWSGRWRDGDRFASADRIRNRWRGRDRDWNDYPFYGTWWDRGWSGGRRWNHWDRWSHNRPWYWWAFATAPRLYGYFNYGWQRPYYWDYGPGEYIYYDNGGMYVNGRWYQPATVYYDDTVRLVERAPDLTPEDAAQMEWLPLGVFAVTRDGREQPDLLVQLAVTQDGVIAGTANDQRTSAAYPIEGVVEKETQRAVWSYTDDRNQRVVMETSIFNLTQPEATGLVHYGPDDIQVVELVRLEAPEGQAVATEGELPVPVR